MVLCVAFFCGLVGWGVVCVGGVWGCVVWLGGLGAVEGEERSTLGRVIWARAPPGQRGRGRGGGGGGGAPPRSRHKTTPPKKRPLPPSLSHHPVPVDRQVLPPRGQQRELRDHLLRELVRAVHVVPARDDDGQPVGRPVGLAEHLGARLGGAVRVGRLEHAALGEALGGAQGRLAVDLVGADVDEAADGRGGGPGAAAGGAGAVAVGGRGAAAAARAAAAAAAPRCAVWGLARAARGLEEHVRAVRVVHLCWCRFVVDERSKVGGKGGGGGVLSK